MIYLIGPAKEVKRHIENSNESESVFHHLKNELDWNIRAGLIKEANGDFAFEDDCFVGVTGALTSSTCRELITKIRSDGFPVSLL